MKWAAVLAIVLSVGACTKANPKSCKDGLCTEQQYPFCDVDGTLGGDPQECITVACTPNEFASCRGDQELRCNSTGNNYDTVRCELGCDANSDGCRLCEANETRCTNGKVAVCDGAGAVTSVETCGLGCFEDQPRCRKLDPSNNLAQYYDMVSLGPKAEFTNAHFEVDTGRVLLGQQPVSVPSFLASAQGNGVPIRVYIVNTLKLEGTTLFFATGDPRNAPVAGVAVIARGDISISGELVIESRVGGAVTGCAAGTGSSGAEPNGGIASSGGGGGGNATDGTDGGDVTSVRTGGVRGIAASVPELVPLRGGCAGGFQGNIGPGTYHNGGGAIQLSSGTKIDINGIVNAAGRSGEADAYGVRNVLILGGGGAGGSILLEAPEVTLGSNAKLLASGGDGAQGCTTPSAYCGAAGKGATASAAATAGASVPFPTTSETDAMSGGGGGGLGRVRVNTKTGDYTKSSGAVEAAVVTAGTVRTR